MIVKFLVADDSGVMRKMIIETLYQGNVFNPENALIFEAADGEAGLELFQKTLPQVVLADTEMPKMDGVAMSKKIRELDRKVPIIMFAAEGGEAAVREALSAGVITDYVVKPVQPGMLEEKLLKAFETLKGEENA